MGLFGKSEAKPPKVMVQEWTSKIRKEGYILDRQIRSIQREEEKVKRSMKDAAKKGEREVCRILAKEVVNSRKAVNKIYSAKAHLKSIEMGMKNQLSTLRIAGALEKSTQVMNCMQALIKIPEIQATMRDMSKEMMKAGIIEEMLEDTMDMDNDEELEEETQEAVDKVLFELTSGEIGRAPAAVNDSLPPLEPEGATADVSDEEDDMRERLAALRS